MLHFVIVSSYTHDALHSYHGLMANEESERTAMFTSKDQQVLGVFVCE